MLSKRIIPCLDVRNGRVVKGVKFKNHEDLGSVSDYTERYANADELVFYDITASTENRSVDLDWVEDIATNLHIPFCVAGGINSVKKAEQVLSSGADKISINTPALMTPSLITEIAKEFGSQAVTLGVDSLWVNDDYYVYSHTGSETTQKQHSLKTIDWIQKAQDLGAGEVVLNCMGEDGMKKGFDIKQLQDMRAVCKIPLIASGGAGSAQDFLDLFQQVDVSGALAASVFHKNILSISELRKFLAKNSIPMRTTHES